MWRIPHGLSEMQSEPRNSKTVQVKTTKAGGRKSSRLCSVYWAVVERMMLSECILEGSCPTGKTG